MGVITRDLSSNVRQRLRRRQSLEARLAEAVDSVNSLALAGAGAVRAPESTKSGDQTSTQRQVLSHLWRRLAKFPRDPEARSDREALSALLKTVDLYALDISTRAPYDPSKLNILRGTAPPRELADRLEGELLSSYINFDIVIEKSQEEV